MDLDLEASSLGAAFYSVEAARAIAAADPAIFYLDKHRDIQRALANLLPQLNGSPPDVGLLKAYLGEQADAALLARLLDAGTLAVYIAPYLVELRELAAQREEQAAELEVVTARDHGQPVEWRRVDERRARAAALRGSVTIGPGVIEGRVFLDKHFTDTPAIVGCGILPRSALAILGGPPKVGKSSLALSLALRRGGSWLGFPSAPGKTLVVQAEIPERELQTRLRLMLQDLDDGLPPDSLFLVSRRGLYLDEPTGRQTCRRWLEDVRPDLVIVDPLGRFYGGDENSSRDMSRLVAGVDELIQEFGVAVLLVHHTGKPAVGDPREGGQRLRGSSVLFAAADTVMVLDKAEGRLFKLGFELRHGPEPEPLLLARSDRLWFTASGPPQGLLDVAALVAHEPLRFGQLVHAVMGSEACSKATAERLVARAKTAGLIRRSEGGVYVGALTHHQSATEGEGKYRE